MDLNSLRKNIGIMPQESVVFNTSIINNICINETQYDDMKLQSVIKAAQIDSMLQGLQEGLNTIIGEHGVNLSGGEKQKIAFARLLMTNANLLLLDEFSSALDSNAEEHIVTQLQALKMAGKTIIIITHHPKILKYCDNILIVERGKIVLQSSYAEFMQTNSCYNIFNKKIVEITSAEA